MFIIKLLSQHAKTSAD